MSNYETISGVGPLDAPIWIIEELPTREEGQSQRAFTGSTARFIKEKLGTYGYPPELIRYEFVAPFYYPVKQLTLEQMELDSVMALEVVKHVTKTKKTIRESKPRLVLLLGAFALKYFANRAGKGDLISDYRGHVEWSHEMDVKIMATYRPSHAMRQRWVEKANKPGQYEVLFQSDICKAIKEATTRVYAPTLVDAVICTSYQQAVAELDKMWDSKMLAFDIETSGLCMVCISFANSLNRGITIPLIKTTYCKGELNQFWRSEAERLDLYWRIKQLLQSTIPKVAQNSQFDMAMLWKMYGIRVQNLVHDTMVASHNLYCDLPKDLGTLISLYGNYQYHKDLFGNTDLMKFWEYCAKDSITTLGIYVEQLKEMKEFGIFEHYRDVTNPLIPCLVEMQMNGVKVDEPSKDRVVEHLRQYTTAILAGIRQLLGQPEFNLQSWVQKQKLFYGALKLNPIWRKGRLATDVDAIEEIGASHPGVLQYLCKMMVEYAEKKHLLQVLLTPLDKGRMHCAYDVSGTDTGRLNSKETIFGTGTNLQNLQKGWPRKMLIAG